ncbi:MAG: hypothetical protein ACKVOR_03105 [Flavobacteriales bacterium]
MRHLILTLFVFSLLCSCADEPTQTAFNPSLDSLRSEIRELKELLKKDSVPVKVDTVVVTKIPIVTIPKEEVLDDEPKREKKKKKETHEEIKPVRATNEPTLHKYKNGKLSVKITKWNDDGHRFIYFYNARGEETFSLEDINLSYTVFTHLSFHPNGAASVANISMNPGASLYWYEDHITFDEDNYPIQKSSHRMPYGDLEESLKLPEVWNRETKQWEKPK